MNYKIKPEFLDDVKKLYDEVSDEILALTELKEILVKLMTTAPPRTRVKVKAKDVQKFRKIIKKSELRPSELVIDSLKNGKYMDIGELKVVLKKNGLRDAQIPPAIAAAMRSGRVGKSGGDNYFLKKTGSR